MTYPHEAVRIHLAEHTIPVKLRIDRTAVIAKRFDTIWTPGLVWTTAQGEVGHRTVGWFAPEELVAESLVGCGHVAARRADWETARRCFEEAADGWPETHAAPAGRYWAGVAAKKATGEVDELVGHWKRLRRDHAESPWAMRVAFLDG